MHFITAGGRANALVLFLMPQPSQYYGPYSTDTTGFRVLVHDQNEWPDVENHGIDVSPGFLTTLPIKRHEVFMIIKRKLIKSSSLVIIKKSSGKRNAAANLI